MLTYKQSKIGSGVEFGEGQIGRDVPMGDEYQFFQTLASIYRNTF